MRHKIFLFLLICASIAWLPSAFAWPAISVENFSGHKQWREERQADKRRAVQERAVQERRDDRSQLRREQAEPLRRQDEGNSERRSLSPDERRELRRQIRHANQDGNR